MLAGFESHTFLLFISLEVYVDGKWRIVCCPDDCIVINTGFLLEKLTGGAIKATQHRVINRNAKEVFVIALVILYYLTSLLFLAILHCFVF